MYVWITINFRSRSLENFRPQTLREAQHVDCPVHASLSRLHWIALVVDWRGGTGEIVDLINFDVQWECHVMADHFKALVAKQMFDIAASAAKIVIDANHISPFREQTIAKVRAKKTRSPCNQYSLLEMHLRKLATYMLANSTTRCPK
jgi:hypothetical protein